MISNSVIAGVFFGLASIVSAQSGPSGPWQLKFSDEFNGTSLDTSKWGTQYPWGCHNNDEQECYQAANVTASGGLLHLTAKQQTVTSGGSTYNYTSGMIQSSGSFSQTYGYFEMRAKIPKGQGFWPAFWTMPANGNWPPEIDIIEIGKGGDFNTARMTLHWGSNGSDNYQENDWVSTDFSQAFHVFAVDWEPGIVTWYIDGVQRAQMSTSNVPTIPMYVLANLAVGGSWPGNVNSSTPLPSNMDIDYIRVWSKTSSTCYANIPSPTDPIPTTPCPSSDTQAPTAPTNLTATAVSSSQINLSWTASTDNVGVTGYNILRNGTKVGTSATNSYSDTGLSASTTYTYTVSAFDAGNNVSTNSASASATTQAAPPTMPVISSFSASPSSITPGQSSTLSWSVSGNPAPTLTVNGSTVSGSSMTVSPSATTSYTLVATNSVGSATANVTVTVSSSVLPTGLTSYWSFDEGAGTTAADGSGNGNTGTVQGTATWAAGKIGPAAMTFAGTSANYLSTAKSYVNPATFSLALWFKTATVQGGKLIGFEKNQTGSSGNFDRHIYMDNSGKLYFGVYNGAQRSINSTASYNNNAWHHVVGALSPTSGMTLYVDGVLVASNTTVTSAENNTEFWRVGGGSLDSGWPAVPSSFYFNGSLDDVRIYDHALTSSEVGGVYSLGGGSSDTTAPSTPTGLSATAISASQVNLTWTASTDNVGVTGYKVFRNGTQIATPATNSYNDTGLAASTTYSYTVSAYDAAGNNSPQTSAVLATTQAATDTQAPTVPTNLTATAVSSSQINLSWTASTDNVGVTGYKVFRGGVQIGTATGTTYQNTGLTASTTYSYTVSAYDAAGNNSGQSTAVSATTQAATDTQAPTVPTNLTATAVSSSQINLSWTASTDNVGVTGYKVFRGGAQIGTATGTTYQNTGLAASTTYSYTVSAYDAAGNNSAQTSAVLATTQAATDTQAPTVPTNLTATAVSSSQINLSWTASTDNVGVTGYKVFRGGAQIGTATGTTYQNTGLAASTTYSYTVSAYDAAGNNSAQSTAVSATTSSSSTTYSIWNPTDAPNNVSEPDPSKVEVGVKFRANTAGSILGIRFYKGVNNSGNHIGYLWSNNGALLASATFTGETASGWQQVNFASPVAIAANTTYIASYYTPTGYYSEDYHYLSNSGVTNGPLTALRDGIDGPNGVYVYAKGAFPSSGYLGSNYWVDVVFTPSGSPAGMATTLSMNAKATEQQVTPGGLGGASLSCSPGVGQAGSSLNCELQLTDDAQPEIPLDSSIRHIRLPAVVVARTNQHSLSFQASVDESALQGSATISGMVAGRKVVDRIMTAAAPGPIIHVPPDRLVKYGTLIGYKISVDSVDPAVLSVDKLPAGAYFDVVTGDFRWTPEISQQGTYNLTFTARSPAGSSSKSMRLEVDAGSPVINPLRFACSPGAIGVLNGKWLGPDEPVADASGSSTELASTRVRVNGALAPVLYADQTQVSFVCPDGAAGDGLQIAVDTAAGSTEAFQTTMRAANPVLLAGANGRQGQIFLNGTRQLATVRDVSATGLPAQPGDLLSVRASGIREGLSLRVKIGGASANVHSIAPVADAAGVWEIQAEIPEASGFGDAVPVQLETTLPDGSQLQSNTVTMAIEPVRQ